MLELKKFFTDFEELVKRLECRGISREKLLVIQEKLIKRKELNKKVDDLRSELNKLNKEGIKNSKKAEKINERRVPLPVDRPSHNERALG